MRKIFNPLLIVISLFNLSISLVACQFEKKPVFDSITSALKTTKLTIFSTKDQDVEYLKQIILINIFVSLLTTDFQNNITFNFLPKPKDEEKIEVLNQATQAPIDDDTLDKIQTLTIIIKVELFLTFVTLPPAKLHIEELKSESDILQDIKQFDYSLYTNLYSNRLVNETFIYDKERVPFVIGAKVEDYIAIWKILLTFLNCNLLGQFVDLRNLEDWIDHFEIVEILIKKNQKLEVLTDQDLIKPQVINLVIKYRVVGLTKEEVVPVNVRIIEP